MPNGPKNKNGTSAAKADGAWVLGFKAKLCAAADALCRKVDAAEYKHVVKLVGRAA